MPAEEKQQNLSSLEKVETRQTDGDSDASPKGEHESEEQNVENKVSCSCSMERSVVLIKNAKGHILILHDNVGSSNGFRGR